MKTAMTICLLILLFGVNSAMAESIVKDNFNSYTNGSVVGQGNWESYSRGDNFLVQGTTTFEGAKALYNNSSQDSVIGKAGDLLTDGRQTVYVRTEDRDSWGTCLSGNVQVRMTKNLWAQQYGSYFFVSFYKDGIVGLNGYPFDTYQDNTWTPLEMEWRSSDTSARVRVNDGAWTNWESIIVPQIGKAPSFTDFDYIGFDFDGRGGSGGVYFDTLGTNTPEPSTIALLISGLIAGGFFLRHRRK